MNFGVEQAPISLVGGPLLDDKRIFDSELKVFKFFIGLLIAVKECSVHENLIFVAGIFFAELLKFFV